ncbi:hypothetical protein NM208_g16752 [Fusarium decemcellulare]|uniref:Uncharacterized protein n=1 Tax=Fusarium decemcellulare TaxID=57161 RepID=A0ACC1R9U8_9HYPO|nr:hypothetical protein NM208_g16752 [Fusarium decemcellulare]
MTNNEAATDPTGIFLERGRVAEVGSGRKGKVKVTMPCRTVQVTDRVESSRVESEGSFSLCVWACIVGEEEEEKTPTGEERRDGTGLGKGTRGRSQAVWWESELWW